MAKNKLEPTPADYEAVRRRIEEEDPREGLIRALARIEARSRIARERDARRRARVRRLTFGLLGR